MILKTATSILQRYAHVYHNVEHATHLGYFALVFTHGPYHWAAGVLFVLGVLALVLRVGEEM